MAMAAGRVPARYGEPLTGDSAQAGFFSTLRGIAAAPGNKFSPEIGAGEPDASDDDRDHKIVNTHVVSRCAAPKTTGQDLFVDRVSVSCCPPTPRLAQ